MLKVLELNQKEVKEIILQHCISSGYSVENIVLLYKGARMSDEFVCECRLISERIISAADQEKFLITPISELDLSSKAFHALKGSSIKNMREILDLYRKTNSWSEVNSLRNVGDKITNELEVLFKNNSLM